MSFAGIALQASEDRDWKVYDLQYGALFRLFQAQNALLERFNLLSPILAMRDVSRSLAGTDLYKHLNFTRQAENHRRLVAKVMNTDQKINGVVQERDYKAGVALWQKSTPIPVPKPKFGRAASATMVQFVQSGVLVAGLDFLPVPQRTNFTPGLTTAFFKPKPTFPKYHAMRNFYFIAFYDWLMLRANKMLLSCFALLALFVAFAFWTGQQQVAFLFFFFFFFFFKQPLPR